MSKSQTSFKIDESDIQIIDLLAQGKSNQEISLQLDIPISTIQRRTRRIQQSGIVTVKTQINYEKLGFKTGLVYIYLSDGDINETIQKVYDLEGITFVEIHIGNPDILANVIYKEGKELLSLITAIKKMKGIERIVWSERIYRSSDKSYHKLSNGDKEQILNFDSG